MITLQQVGLQRGSKVLLEEASMRLHDGQKAGLIGANGCGKSSLFRMLTGELHCDRGDCQIPRQWRIAHMAQELVESDRHAIDYVMDGDSALRALQGEIQVSDGEHLAELYARLEAMDGYTAETRAQELLHGLGFGNDAAQRPVSEFSGGWRIRLNLARALMTPADLLLLDEPTNHLDLDTTWWLEQRLQQYRGTLLIISHDRDFLDNTVQHIVHLENRRLQLYSGNYSAFERQRAERLAQQQQLHLRQQARIAEIERFIARFKAKASKARQAQSRIKALQRLETIAPAHVDSPFSFHIQCAEKTSQPLLQLTQCELGYDHRPLLGKVGLRIDPGSRIGLLGPNGAGKSTLMKSLCGDLSIISGSRVCGEHLKIGYFNQHQLQALDLDASAALHLQRLSAQASEQEIRNFLGGFDFRGDRALEPIHHFSGGEKARLALAIIAWQQPNLLLLDEPTNHLDLEMREALTLALQDFQGALVVVSHDRHLLRNSVDEFILVSDGRVAGFDGDLAEYHQWLQKRGATPADSRSAMSAGSAETVDRRQQRQHSAELRKRLQPLRKQVRAAEQRMDRLQQQLSQLELQLSDPQLYDEASRNQEVTGLLQQQGSLRQQMTEAENLWLSLSDEYETLESQD